MSTKGITRSTFFCTFSDSEAPKKRSHDTPEQWIDPWSRGKRTHVEVNGEEEEERKKGKHKDKKKKLTKNHCLINV